MAKARRLTLVSDNTAAQKDDTTSTTAEVVKLDTAKNKPKRTRTTKAKTAETEAPVEAKKEEPVIEKAPETPEAKKPTKAKKPKKTDNTFGAKAEKPADKPVETAPVETTPDKPIEAVKEEAVQPAKEEPAQQAAVTQGSVLKEEEKIVAGPVIPRNVLSAIIAYKTIYALNTLNKKTGKLTATHYAICLVSGRNPTWAVFTVASKFQRLRNSMQEVERDYPRLSVRKVMSEFRLNNTMDLTVEKRRNAIETLLSSQ